MLNIFHHFLILFLLYENSVAYESVVVLLYETLYARSLMQ